MLCSGMAGPPTCSPPLPHTQVGPEIYRTRPVSATVNPSWNETFTFQGSDAVSAGMTVAFEV